MTRQTRLTLGVALLSALAGAGAMYWVASPASAPAAPPAPPPGGSGRNAPDPALQSAATGQIEMLRRQAAALENERDRLEAECAALQQTLSDRDREIARLRQATAAASSRTNAPAGNDRRRGSFEERLAQFQRDEPERAAEMQRLRDEFRQRMQTQVSERTDFLNRVETANMSEAQRANHEELLQLAGQIREWTEQMPNMTREEADQARRKMFESYGRLSTLYAQERRYLLEATGESLGYKGQEAVQFADQIQMIYDQTSMMPTFGRGGGRDGRRGNNNPAPAAPAPAP